MSNYDLGEVHFSTFEDAASKLSELNPYVAIVFNEDTARQVKAMKEDVFVYIANDPGRIFYRKAESEAKQEKQRQLFADVSRMVQKLRMEDEKGHEAARMFAAMDYNAMYSMIKRAIVGDNQDLAKQAWALLLDNNGHKDFLWMRVQIMVEAWEAADGPGKEKFLCMVMQDYIDEGFARPLPDFVDIDGAVYRQYMFCYLDGSDANYIRRIPYAQQGQRGTAYDAILSKYETPNGVRMLFEFGRARKLREESGLK